MLYVAGLTAFVNPAEQVSARRDLLFLLFWIFKNSTPRFSAEPSSLHILHK